MLLAESKSTGSIKSLIFRQTQLSLLIGSALISQPLLAASFTIVDGQAATTTQTLDANETGIIERGGRLTTTAGNGVDIDSQRLWHFVTG